MADSARIDVSRDVLNTNRRLNIGSFVMNLGKFALDSAIDVSLKGFNGGKKLYHTFLQEKIKDQPTRLKLEDVKLMEEKNERQLTKMEDIYEFKQQSKIATYKAVVRSEPMKKKNIPQGIKEMELQDPTRNRIFIRSRL